MGWWRIKNVETGQIDFKTGGKGKLVNGDDPADTFGDAITKVIGQYEENFGRKPSMEEIQAAFNFVYNGLPGWHGLKTAKEMGLE